MINRKMLLIILAIVVTLSTKAANEPSEPTEPMLEISAGAFWKPLPSTIAYEATVPLVYQNEWMEKSETKEEKTACRNTDPDECSLFAQLDDLREIFKEEFNILEMSWSTVELREASSEHDNERKRAIEFLGEGLAWCCGVATQRKLDSFMSNEKEIRKEVKKLQKGIAGSLKIITEQSSKFKDYTNKVSQSLNQTDQKIRLINKYLRQAKEYEENRTDKNKKIHVMLARHEFEMMKNTIQLVRAMKSQQILTTCKQHLIPRSIIGAAILKHDLKQLSEELEKYDQDLAIPVSDVHKLYELPICDCVVSGDIITIHIRVPITQRGRKWKMFELITAPFAWNNHSCRINHDTLYLAASETEPGKPEQIRQISGTGIHNCRPYMDKLCYLPRFSGDSRQGPSCAEKLFYGATVNDIGNHCPLTCHPSSTYTITEVAEEVYIITQPRALTVISCDDKKMELPRSSYNKAGATKITLPCNCQLEAEKVLIPKRFPCHNLPISPTLKHVIPATWSRLKSVILNPIISNHLPTFTNISEAINSNWTMEIPYLNLTAEKKNMEETIKMVQEQWDEKITPDNESYSSKFGIHGDTIFLIWNTALSVCVIYILFRNNGLAVMPAVAVPARGETPNSVAHHTILISLIGVTLAVFFICLAYYLYKKWKAHKKSGTDRKLKLKTRAKTLNLEIVEEEGLNALQRRGRLTIVISTPEEDVQDNEEC